MKINAAFDKQMEKGQHFDIISQVPKKGHRHEQVYVQRTKPPSLVTARWPPTTSCPVSASTATTGRLLKSGRSRRTTRRSRVWLTPTLGRAALTSSL